MSIDRTELIKRNNPCLSAIDYHSPLTVGNGEFAFTADITGLQTLAENYEKEKMPLCTLSQFIWHSSPLQSDHKEIYFTEADVEETEYSFHGRRVSYPVEEKKGSEAAYRWRRQNPHRPNLVRVRLVKPCGAAVLPEEISEIHQILHMESGLLESHFRLSGASFTVSTCCAGNYNAVGFRIHCEQNLENHAAVEIAFPYGSGDISGSDWNSENRHETIVEGNLLHRILDRDGYEVSMNREKGSQWIQTGKHSFLLLPTDRDFSLVLHFGEKGNCPECLTIDEAENRSEVFWKSFWNSTGVIDLHKSSDLRAEELERRIVLSQYLLRVNSSGSLPPQETGLTCCSWYGKFHMEMYLWHESWLPLFGLTDVLEKSLDWCLKRLPEAKVNAAHNGYAGARWPKQVAFDAINSPSPIAPLLIWQQPHIIYMLYLCYRSNEDIRKYEPLIRETADFMTDFAVRSKEGFYELLAPLIPVQECHPPKDTNNPAFEVEYWITALRMAAEMERYICTENISLSLSCSADYRKAAVLPQNIEKTIAAWLNIADGMIALPSNELYYLARSECPETYSDYAVDHPSMLMAYGLIDSGRIDQEKMERTLKKVLEVWDWKSLWGWDFGVMAMTAVRLGKPELALELILKDTYKNRYVISGNNRQETADTLPLYLPGNGALLLTAAIMTAGYDGCEEKLPGFPKDGKWIVEYEGIRPLP